MSFITKLDFSSNRQVKQYEKSFTALSGGTQFGMPYSALTTGPDLSTTAETQTYTNLVSTFSGNSATTVFNWYDPNMSLGEPYLSAITPSTSATTQEVGPIFTGATTGLTQDGYTYNINYSGVSFDLIGLAMIDLGGGAYSGSVHTNNLIYYSAGTLDFSGRTIWVDVSGITRTNDLIITNSPQIGYVWTCIDSEGKGQWGPSSGGTGYWTAGTQVNSIVPINNSSGNNKLGINIDPQTSFDLMTNNGRARVLVYESGDTNSFVISGNTSGYTQIGVTTKSTGTGGFGLTLGSIGSNQSGYPAFGQPSETFIFSSGESDGLNITKNSGPPYSNNNNFIRFYAGGNPSNITDAHIHIQGSGSTQGNIGLSTQSPTQKLDVNGNGRFRSIGSAASAGALHYTSDGTLTTNTSDIRLKENINPILNALNIIKGLSGVTYQWIDKISGSDAVRIGFIAQQVESVEPRLTFTNPVDNYMGIHTNDIIPILVEAIKELTSGSTISENTYLETQSIIAEDNNIDLNYGGNQQTAVDGGIRVLHALGQDLAAELLIDSDGNWRTNTGFIPYSIILPSYTPKSSNDTNGLEGSITRDDDYFYIKTKNGWMRSKLEGF